MSAVAQRRGVAGRSAAAPATPQTAARRGYVPLLHRVAALNVVLVLTAVGLTVLVLAPGRVSSLAVDAEALAIAAAVVVVVLANVFVLRRLVGPVQALTALARRVDLTSPRGQMPAATATSEAGELALTFNEMLDRLQAERREATGRVLAAQEAERLRIAQELHDQVGQELTAVLLGLSRLQSRAPDPLRGDVGAVETLVQGSLEEVRRIAIELRPEALADLGLPGALAVLAERCAERLDLEVALTVSEELPPMPADIELVTYRIAQEALTNVARHAGVRSAELALTYAPARLTLTVRDRGRGLPAGTPAGTGVRGMRERATLIGGRLTLGEPELGPGCELRLEVPLA